jgi:hypothetical protein
MKCGYPLVGGYCDNMCDPVGNGSPPAATNAHTQIDEFQHWLDLELIEGTCPEFLAAIRKVRAKFVEIMKNSG